MPWAVDLACCKEDDVEDYLDLVPGIADQYIPNLLCCGLLRRRWRQQRVTLETARTVGVVFYWNHSLPTATESQTNWTEQFYLQTEEFDRGSLTEGDLRQAIKQHLEPFIAWEEQLPEWVD